jgi:uncharacterized protein YggE
MWALALLAVASPVPAQMAGPHEAEARPSLFVSASAEVRVAPDRAQLSIAVETRGRTSTIAGTENARIQTAVLEAVRRLGVTGEQLQTRAVQVMPEYQYPREGGRPTVTGYAARNEISVELADPSKVGAVIDAALAQGATNVSGPRYSLASPDSARREALDAAVRKAMADAQVMARAAGVRAGRVLELSSDGSSGVMETGAPVVMMRAAADAAPTPTESGLITVRATVQLRVAIVP